MEETPLFGGRSWSVPRNVALPTGKFFEIKTLKIYSESDFTSHHALRYIDLDSYRIQLRFMPELQVAKHLYS